VGRRAGLRRHPARLRDSARSQGAVLGCNAQGEFGDDTMAPRTEAVRVLNR
jgi:hypothetical protein